MKFFQILFQRKVIPMPTLRKRSPVKAFCVLNASCNLHHSWGLIFFFICPKLTRFWVQAQHKARALVSTSLPLGKVDNLSTVSCLSEDPCWYSYSALWELSGFVTWFSSNTGPAGECTWVFHRKRNISGEEQNGTVVGKEEGGRT